MNDIKLPPLPPPSPLREHRSDYSAGEMQAFAIEAIEADRQVRGGDQINQKQPETRANTGLGGGDQRAAFETEMRKDLGIPDHLELNWEAEYVATAWKYYQAALASPEVQALRKDAERYRAMRNAAANDRRTFTDDMQDYAYTHFADPQAPTEKEFDAAIDHARRVEGDNDAAI